MSNLTTLLKVSLRESLDKRKFKQNKKQQTFFVYALLMALLFIGISVLYSVIYAMNFVAANQVEYIYTLTLVFFAITTFTTFTSSISKMQTIFMGSDYELLSSLPIKKSDIVLSKIFNLYVVELIISLIIIVPNSIVNLIISKNLIYLAFVPLAFVAPAFPMLLALLVTALLELLIKSKKVKTIIATAATLIMVTAIMVFAFTSSFQSSSNGSNVGMIMNVSNAAVYINPSLFFLNFAFLKNPIWILAYVGSNLVLLMIVLSIVTAAFTKIHNNMLNTKLASQKSKKSKKTDIAFRTPNKEIRHFTIKNFFRSKNSIMQCSIGLFMTILFSIGVAVAARMGAIKVTITETGEQVNVFAILKPYIFCIVIFFSFFVGIMPPAATSISLEGKNFQILKSLPIDFKAFLKEKLLFSFIVMLIPSLISSLIIAIFIEQTIFSIIICILFPIVFAFFSSCYTLIINSAFPYLTWKEEIEVYKYHKSTLITVFTEMGISMATIVLAIILAMINPYVSGIVITSIYLILSVVLFIILMKVSSRKLQTLEVFD